MQVSSVLDNSTVDPSSSASPSTSQQTSEKAASFASHFLKASSSTASGSSASTTDPVDDAVKEFMDYANETPEQRLFSNWLGSQGISEKDYKAMSPAQQQALHNKFAQQLQEKMKDNPLASANVAITANFSTPATKSNQATALPN